MYASDKYDVNFLNAKRKKYPLKEIYSDLN